MHPAVMTFVGDVVEHFHLAKSTVLEVGSYDENGSVRPFFRGRYVGVDMREGPGVDIVSYGWSLPFRDQEFEVVVSTSTLEHDPAPWRTLEEMARVLESAGYMILTTVSIGYPRHDYPCDYWRFTGDGIRRLIEHEARLDVIELQEDEKTADVFCLARKGGLL